MLEKFTYTNSFNETLEFGKDCLFVNENDLRDFAWGVTSKNNKISSFKKGIVQKTIPIIIKCDSEDEGISLRNRLFEVFEKDVLARQHGKIKIGDYYLRCYITGSKKTQYLIHKSYMVVSLTVQTDLPEWVKETTSTHQMSIIGGDGFLDYPYDFEYDYQNRLVNANIVNEAFAPSNFVLKIEGYAHNPTLFIGNHRYSVNVTVGDGEILTIDSVNKTITLNKNGTMVNCFNDRYRDSYIFEKIPSGTSVVTSPNEQLKFTLTLLEERSEPKWT